MKHAKKLLILGLFLGSLAIAMEPEEQPARELQPRYIELLSRPAIEGTYLQELPSELRQEILKYTGATGVQNLPKNAKMEILKRLVDASYHEAPQPLNLKARAYAKNKLLVRLNLLLQSNEFQDIANDIEANDELQQYIAHIYQYHHNKYFIFMTPAGFLRLKEESVKDRFNAEDAIISQIRWATINGQVAMLQKLLDTLFPNHIIDQHILASMQNYWDDGILDIAPNSADVDVKNLSGSIKAIALLMTYGFSLDWEQLTHQIIEDCLKDDVVAWSKISIWFKASLNTGLLNIENIQDLIKELSDLEASPFTERMKPLEREPVSPAHISLAKADQARYRRRLSEMQFNAQILITLLQELLKKYESQHIIGKKRAHEEI